MSQTTTTNSTGLHALQAADRSVPVTAAEMSRSDRLRRRVAGLVVALVTGAVLGIAVWLSPSAEGIGTHRQLIPFECGWIAAAGMPCPTCGMTTAFTHAADGNLLASFRTQPMGAILAVCTAMLLLLGSYVAATGSRIGAELASMFRPRIGWAFAMLLVLAWIYKILAYKGVL